MSRSASAFDDNNDEEMVNRPQRARAATSYKEEDDDDEEEEGGMPKKRKASGKSRSKKSHGDSDDDENTPPDASTKSKSKRAKKMPSSSSSSSGFRSEDEERHEMDAESDEDTQQRHHKRTDYETGQILSIKVTDFMCHHKLSLDFGRHVNFITGDNGSGKSAIVAALQLCLGANANNTGRGRNLSAFIREGSDGPAIVQLKLLNKGADAFKPDEYGDSITIERRINKTGAAGYKFMDENGKVVSTKSDELHGLQSHINAHMDNPCCVLTQEESKKFIQGHERDKYEFFLKATGLQATHLKIKETQETCDETEKDMARRKARLEIKEQNVDKLYQEYQKLLELDEIDGQIQLCVAKRFWFDHALLATVVQGMGDKLQNFQHDLATKQAELAKAEADEAQIGSIEEITAVVESVAQRQTDAENDLNSKKKAVFMKQKELNEVERDRRLAAQNKAEQISSLAQLNADILEAKTKARNSANDGELVLIKQIDACTRAIVAEETKERTAKEERNTLSNQLRDLEGQVRVWDAKVHEHDNEIRHLSQELSQSSSSSSGQDRRLNQFGRNIGQVMNAINQSKSKFREMPIGPLGMYVKLEPGQGRQWGKAVEKNIGMSLRAFVVSNASDQRILTDLIRQCGASYEHKAIYQSKGGRYNVPRVPGATTVNDVCLVDDDQVFNCLIDQCGLDTCILINNEHDIDPLKGPRGFKNPQIKKAMYPTGDTLAFNMHNNLKNTVNRQPLNGNLLVEDQAERANTLKEEIAEQKVQQKEAVKRREEIRVQYNQVKDQIGAIDQRIKSITSEIRKQRYTKSKLENDLAEKQAEQVLDTSDMERDVELLQGEIEGFEREESRLKEEIVELSRDANDLKKAQRQSEQERESLVKELKDAERKLEQYEMGRKSRLKRKNDAKRAADESQGKVDDVQRKLTEKEKEKEEALNKANEGTRDLLADWDGKPLQLNDRETKDYLEQKMKQLKKKLEDGRAKAGLEGRTKASVSERFQKAKDDLQSDREQNQQILDELNAMRESLQDRRKKWSTQLRMSAKGVNAKFGLYLSRKGFSGTAKFDHKEQTLTLVCQVDNSNDGTRVKDVRQLSGGERSYTTLCLLLALGHVIEAPFRLMDEYDVFLDEISRQVTLDELLKYALLPEQLNRQFVIITPNNLNNVKTSANVKIQRMQKPNRGTVE